MIFLNRNEEPGKNIKLNFERITTAKSHPEFLN